MILGRTMGWKFVNKLIYNLVYTVVRWTYRLFLLCYQFKHLDLLRDGFGDRQYFHCLIPEYVTTDKVIPIGFTIYYFTYSTWKGRRVLHVDDLYVEPEYRGNLYNNSYICDVIPFV